MTNQTKPTPGPWEVHAELNVQTKERFVASCGMNSSNPSCFNECKANARLIAAAPELLKELKSLLEEIETRQRKHDCPGFDCAICTPNTYEAEQAIAKAEGTR